jgi:hypothetical protein
MARGARRDAAGRSSEPDKTLTKEGGRLEKRSSANTTPWAHMGGPLWDPHLGRSSEPADGGAAEVLSPRPALERPVHMATFTPFSMHSPTSVTDSAQALVARVPLGKQREPLSAIPDFRLAHQEFARLHDPPSLRLPPKKPAAASAPATIDAADSAMALALLAMSAPAAPVDVSRSPSRTSSSGSLELEGGEEEDEEEDEAEEGDDVDGMDAEQTTCFVRAALLPAVRRRDPRAASNLKRRLNEEARIRHFGWKMVRVAPAYSGAAATPCWMHPVHGRASSKKQIFRARQGALHRSRDPRPASPLPLPPRQTHARSPDTCSCSVAHPCVDVRSRRRLPPRGAAGQEAPPAALGRAQARHRPNRLRSALGPTPAPSRRRPPTAAAFTPIHRVARAAAPQTALGGGHASVCILFCVCEGSVCLSPCRASSRVRSASSRGGSSSGQGSPVDV